MHSAGPSDSKVFQVPIAISIVSRKSKSKETWNGQIPQLEQKNLTVEWMIKKISKQASFQAIFLASSSIIIGSVKELQ